MVLILYSIELSIYHIVNNLENNIYYTIAYDNNTTNLDFVGKIGRERGVNTSNTVTVSNTSDCHLQPTITLQYINKSRGLSIQ